MANDHAEIYGTLARHSFAVCVGDAGDNDYTCGGSGSFWLHLDILKMFNISEEIWIYGMVALFVTIVFAAYFLKLRRRTKTVNEKIRIAKEEGLHEPVSLHPVVNLNLCFGSGACIRACPEQDVLGIRNGKATLINASHCVGHGACLLACPTEAISLHIGTEKRGVDLPHVNQGERHLYCR